MKAPALSDPSQLSDLSILSGNPLSDQGAPQRPGYVIGRYFFWVRACIWIRGIVQLGSRQWRNKMNTLIRLIMALVIGCCTAANLLSVASQIQVALNSVLGL